jgi:hypothetical protein
MNCDEPRNGCSGRGWAMAVAALGACLIFVALVWTTRQYTRPAPLGADRKAERAKALAELRAAETEALNSAAWMDQPKGIVRLPIAEAMKLAEREWQNPAQARSNLIARVEKATALPPKAPEKPSQFE